MAEHLTPRTFTLLIVLAALGRLTHDIIEFRGVSPEWPFMGFALPLLLAYGWRRAPRVRPWLGLVTLLWLALNGFVGGVLSVLPLPIWPFMPEQTWQHYTAHAIYTLSQVPLAVALIRAGVVERVRHPL